MSVATQFAEALQGFEESGDVAPLAGLFSEAAELGNVTTPNSHRGRDGAAEFWQGYRSNFDSIHSEFSNIVESDGVAALEWRSTGNLAEGKPFDYGGVTILELDGEEVVRFTAYFDSAAIVPR